MQRSPQVLRVATCKRTANCLWSTQTTQPHRYYELRPANCLWSTQTTHPHSYYELRKKLPVQYDNEKMGAYVSWKPENPVPATASGGGGELEIKVGAASDAVADVEVMPPRRSRATSGRHHFKTMSTLHTERVLNISS